MRNLLSAAALALGLAFTVPATAEAAVATGGAVRAVPLAAAKPAAEPVYWHRRGHYRPWGWYGYGYAPRVYGYTYYAPRIYRPYWYYRPYYGHGRYWGRRW